MNLVLIHGVIGGTKMQLTIEDNVQQRDVQESKTKGIMKTQLADGQMQTLRITAELDIAMFVAGI